MYQFAIGETNTPVYRGAIPWYDNKSDIETAIGTLAGFRGLIEARYVAGYNRAERLTEFYLFGGRWHLDTCGNTMRSTKDPMPERFRVLLPVATHEEFWKFHADCRSKMPEVEEMISFSMEDSVPLPRLQCAHCGRRWTIENAYDTTVKHSTEVFPLSRFVGTDLGDVVALFEEKTDAVYRMQPDIMLRNDKWIDLSPKYPNPEHDWERSIVVNQRGWRGEKDGIGGDTVIQEGDEAFFNVWKYFHHECLAAHMAEKTKKEFEELLTAAGFTNVTLTETPNRYGSASYRGPWFIVCAFGAEFRIGWRKRVIEIEWGCHPEPLQVKLAALFKNEETTHGDLLVHADGHDHAVSCLARIRGVLETQ